MAPVLLSRTLDPLLGVFTGVLAYYLSETNPRTALEADQRLLPLIQWKIEKSRRRRAEQTIEDKTEDVENMDWKDVVKEK